MSFTRDLNTIFECVVILWREMISVSFLPCWARRTVALYLLAIFGLARLELPREFLGHLAESVAVLCSVGVTVAAAISRGTLAYVKIIVLAWPRSIWAVFRFLLKLVEYFFSPALAGASVQGVLQDSLAIDLVSLMSPHREVHRDFSKNLEMQSHISMRGHSHPTAAGIRTSASASMIAWARSMGYSPYIVSLSARDLEAGLPGTTLQIMGKDAARFTRWDRFPSRACIIMIDVDYYVNMAYWCSSGHPVLIYTFVPLDPAGTVPDATYTTTSNNEIQYDVAGAGRYRHECWDYNQENARVTYCGITIILHIEQMILEVDPTRRIILLNPMRAFFGFPNAYPSVRPLRRRQLLTEGMAVTRYVAVGEDDTRSIRVSATTPGSSVSVNLPEAAWTMLQVKFNESRHQTSTEVGRLLLRYCKQVDVTNEFSAVAVAVVARQIAFCDIPKLIDAAYLAAPPANHYQVIRDYNDTDYPTEQRDYAVRFGPCLLTDEAVYPFINERNELAMIHGRILDVRNNRRPIPPVQRLVHEFVELAVGPYRGTVLPWTIEEVYDHFEKPSQRVRADASWVHLVGADYLNQINAFIKKEAYPAPNYPRAISQQAVQHTMELSRFLLPVTLALKQQHGDTWMGCGMTPTQIECRVRDLAVHHEYLSQTDFSKFDGRVSQWLRSNVEWAVYRGLVSSLYLSELTTLLEKDKEQPAVTQKGLRYRTAWERLSGSPSTSVGNTLINAMVQYVYLRRAGLNRAEAAGSMGVVSGDDGLCPIYQRGRIASVAESFGLVMEVEPATDGPVVFLSRVFVNPWKQIDNHQDVVRVLNKANSSVNLGVSIAQTACNKARGYLTTDSKTPIVGNYFRALLRSYGALEYKYGLDKDLDVRMDAGPWFQRDEEALADSVARQLGLNRDQVLDIARRIDDAGSVEEIADGLIEMRAPAKVAYYIRGPGHTILLPEDASPPPPPARQSRRQGPAAPAQPTSPPDPPPPAPAPADDDAQRPRSGPRRPPRRRPPPPESGQPAPDRDDAAGVLPDHQDAGGPAECRPSADSGGVGRVVDADVALDGAAGGPDGGLDPPPVVLPPGVDPGF